MKLFATTSLVSVLPTRDFAAALHWYTQIFSAPDETPADNMAEWYIAAEAWLQLDGSGEGMAGATAVVIGVTDISACRRALIDAGIAASDIVDYGVVQLCDTRDPDGNRLSFVQVME